MKIQCVSMNTLFCAAIGRAGNTATTKLVVTRFTAEEGQVVENLTLDMTALAFDGDELAAHLGLDDLKGRPILFNNIETNGTYTLTYLSLIHI